MPFEGRRGDRGHGGRGVRRRRDCGRASKHAADWGPAGTRVAGTPAVCPMTGAIGKDDRKARKASTIAAAPGRQAGSGHRIVRRRCGRVRSWWLRNRRRLLDCPNHRRPGRPRELSETDLGLFNGQDRRRVTVVVTTDGRRANLPLDDAASIEVSALALLRSLLIGLDGLIGRLSRREDGGSRR